MQPVPDDVSSTSGRIPAASSEGFAGRVAIVTGASSLIGIEIVRGLLRGGASVVASSTTRNAHHVEALSGEGPLAVVPGNLSEEPYLRELVHAAVTEFGGVDFYVANAAVFADPGLDSTCDDWHSILDVNLISIARLLSLCVPHMRDKGRGSVVIVSSCSGRRSQAGRILYPTSKAAELGLSRNAAQALSADGIRVNAVLPGWTWSRAHETMFESRASADKFAGEIQYMGRMAEAGEVAEGILFLLSDRASFITGTELNVDGGYLGSGPEALGQAFVKVPVIPPS
jgi:NAD(P)-dependent dehydrogenase (short-subunit alcohol dehydrogenase family)